LRELIDLGESNIGSEGTIADSDDDGESEDVDHDVESDDGNLSISAMEAEMLPIVVEKMENIAKICENLLTEIRNHYLTKKHSSSLNTNKKYKTGLSKLIEYVSGVHFNNKRIEEVLTEIYGFNKKLVAK